MRIVITDCDHDAFDEERAVVAATGDELIIANATDPASLIANAAGADALVVQYATITAEILDALPQVRVASRYGVGVDSVDIPAATARGARVRPARARVPPPPRRRLGAAASAQTPQPANP